MARMMQQHFAAADDLVYQEQLEIQLHCEYYKHSVYTHSTLADVIKVSDFFQGYAAHDLCTMPRMIQQHYAAADDLVYQEQLEIQLHCEYYKRSVYTHSTLADVIKVSDFFQAYAAHDLR
ncbi:hypothetical protein ACROYT_G014991 [Oculina patagonica]